MYLPAYAPNTINWGIWSVIPPSDHTPSTTSWGLNVYFISSHAPCITVPAICYNLFYSFLLMLLVSIIFYFMLITSSLLMLQTSSAKDNEQFSPAECHCLFYICSFSQLHQLSREREQAITLGVKVAIWADDAGRWQIGIWAGHFQTG